MGLTATGERAGKRARRTQRLGGREVELGARCAAFEGCEIVGKTRCERVVLGERPRGAGAAVSPCPATTARAGSPREAPRRASAAGAEARVVGRDDGGRAFHPGVRREARCDHPAAAGKPDALCGCAGGQRKRAVWNGPRWCRRSRPRRRRNGRASSHEMESGARAALKLVKAENRRARGERALSESLSVRRLKAPPAGPPRTARSR